MLSWIGEKVGTAGRVVGVEKKPVYLREFVSPPFDIREGDFLEIVLEEPFDLVFSRYSLIHNRNRQEIIRKIFRLLKPEGIAVLEEPDFTSAKLLHDGSDPSHHRVNSAICKMFVDYGLDPGCGLQLPDNLQAEGFQIVETCSTIHLCHGLSPIANLMAESAVVLRQEYQKTGEADSNDIHRYVTNARNPEFWAVYYSTISVIAKRGK